MFINKKDWIITGDSLKKEIESLEDWRYQVEFTSLDTRSLQSNAYIWWWVYPYVRDRFEETGEHVTNETVHELFKYLYLRKRKKCPITKKFRWKEWTTTTLSKKAFRQYLENIDKYCIDKFWQAVPLCHEMEDLYFTN